MEPERANGIGPINRALSALGVIAAPGKMSLTQSNSEDTGESQLGRTRHRRSKLVI
ncbi:hypothetical protein DGo_PA0244 (plasmid) [Deinococcus gobiensis I-0]|uniref:Uncharacterized protein n=2 Tax=Deinococcus TaxID=1298 RepID=H8H078_DEIGI|nr:hypothetical protein DGo_PA0244 [Deinococcus gobiensis I-0]